MYISRLGVRSNDIRLQNNSFIYLFIYFVNRVSIFSVEKVEAN